VDVYIRKLREKLSRPSPPDTSNRLGRCYRFRLEERSRGRVSRFGLTLTLLSVTFVRSDRIVIDFGHSPEAFYSGCPIACNRQMLWRRKHVSSGEIRNYVMLRPDLASREGAGDYLQFNSAGEKSRHTKFSQVELPLAYSQNSGWNAASGTILGGDRRPLSLVALQHGWDSRCC